MRREVRQPVAATLRTSGAVAGRRPGDEDLVTDPREPDLRRASLTRASASRDDVDGLVSGERAPQRLQPLLVHVDTVRLESDARSVYGSARQVLLRCA